MSQARVDERQRIATVCTGIALRAPHVSEILRRRPKLGVLELLADNHLAPGGPARWQARRVGVNYPVALHAVGLSLGSPGRIDRRYAKRLRDLADETGARWVSDHVAFSSWRGRWYQDLLPLPWTAQSLRRLVARVGEAQDLLGRRLYVENASRYLPLAPEEMPEGEFLGRLCKQSGCGLLLDLNNACVSQFNCGPDAGTLVASIPPECIGYVHVAGFTDAGVERLDTHAEPVSQEVWALLAHLTARSGALPVVVERDRNLGSLDALIEEANTAANILRRSRRREVRS